MCDDSLREKCPNKEFFLVRIFLYSDWILRKSPFSVQIQENTEQKKLRIWTLFTQWLDTFYRCNKKLLLPESGNIRNIKEILPKKKKKKGHNKKYTSIKEKKAELILKKLSVTFSKKKRKQAWKSHVMLMANPVMYICRLKEAVLRLSS